MGNTKKFIPVMLMPFCEDMTIDYQALDELIDYYLDNGAEGLFANCLSSEMYQLSIEEMIQSISHIVNRVDGRVPVVATGSFGKTLEEKAGNIQSIYQTGVSAVILITGLLVGESDSEEVFRQNVYALLRLIPGVPVGFYECPVPYKRIISAELLGELVQNGQVKYHKDTCLDIQHVRAKIKATNSTAAFGLYDAYMVHAVQSLKAGAAGLSCIQGNYFPELIAWLCNNYDLPEKVGHVEQVQAFLIENMEIMHATYPRSAKYILQKRGLGINLYCRVNNPTPDADTREKLDTLLKNYNVLWSKIV